MRAVFIGGSKDGEIWEVDPESDGFYEVAVREGPVFPPVSETAWEAPKYRTETYRRYVLGAHLGFGVLTRGEQDEAIGRLLLGYRLLRLDNPRKVTQWGCPNTIRSTFIGGAWDGVATQAPIGAPILRVVVPGSDLSVRKEEYYGRWLWGRSRRFQVFTVQGLGWNQALEMLVEGYAEWRRLPILT